MMARTSWLLDANVVSEMMRPNPEPQVTRFLDRIAIEGIGLSAVTIWEILNGIGRLGPGRRREDLTERFQGILDDLFEERVFDWTADDARACARILEQKRRRGEPLDDHLPDAMLAGAAVRHGLGIVTRNERDFRHTGATTVNPWTRTH